MVANQLTVLGDPTRLAIFERLADGPVPVGQLANGFPVSRSAVSQHLKVLKDAGLVVDERVGNRNYYRPDPEGIEGLRRWFDQFWGKALDAFKREVESSDG